MEVQVKRMSLTKHAFSFVISAMIGAAPALAEKPSWAGEKGGKHDRGEQRDARRGEQKSSKGDRDSHSSRSGRHFDERQHAMVRDYYAGHGSGRCPPGLAKKNNGCMPPGQAKKWRMGQPLPRDVIYYEVPQPLVVKIGLPPAGHRYVRVAGDILMIAVGTGMVVDAINDLGRM